MKKTASKSRPLALRRETVRVLASSQLASAQGGGTLVIDWTDIQAVCNSDIFRPVPGNGGSIARPAECTGTIVTLTPTIIPREP